jgi:hypothetical protein
MTLHLSKSLLNNYRQCPRRLWLEMADRRAVREGRTPLLTHAGYSADTLNRFAQGHVVGRIAQAMWPSGVDIEQQSSRTDPVTGERRRDLGQAAKLTQSVLKQKRPLFEATFEHDGVLVQADVLLPVRSGWHMLEVKSSSQPKPYHLSDLATQVWVAQGQGVAIKGMGLLLVNKDFELQRSGDYTGFLQPHDDSELQAQVQEHIASMPDTVQKARRVIALRQEPVKHQPGEQCASPYPCPYTAHCQGEGAAQGISFYKDNGGNKAAELASEGHTDLRKVPAKRIVQLWNADSDTHQINRRLAQAVRTQAPVLDREGVRRAMANWVWPVQHLDFETINFSAPVWPGTRSGQQVPFQYSVHVQAQNAKVLAHHEFLDTTGQDPRRALALSLIKHLSPDSTILAWNAGTERGALRHLANAFADLRAKLMRLHDRIADLLPVVRDHYAHPDMLQAHGKWFSIKTVLPLLVPGNAYDQLDGVQTGSDAQAVYLRVAAPEALRRDQGYTEETRQQERQQMLKYCEQDTEAMALILRELLKKA